MDEKKEELTVKETKDLGYISGSVLCLVFTACAITVLIGLTIKFLQWVF